MFYLIWEFLIIILETTLFLILANNKLTRKKFTLKHLYMYQYGFLLMVSVIRFGANRYNMSSILTVFLMLAFHMIFVCLFFSDNTFSKLLWSMLYSVFAVIADSTAAIVPIFALHYTKADILHIPSIVRVVFTSLYILILSVLCLVAISLNNKRIRLSTIQKAVFLVISVICVLIEQIDLLSIVNASNNEDQTVNAQIDIFFLIFCLYFCLLFYVYHLGIEKEKNEKLLEESLIYKMDHTQYEQIISSIESLRSLKHDISNHLDTLSLLIKSKEYDKATLYLEKITSELSISHRFLSSGNIPVDCIISNKYISAQNKKISFDYTVHLPLKMPMDDVSICSLLGNLLDNAIESCEKISQPENRFIHLAIKPFNNMLIINIANSSIGDYRFSKSGGFLTTKKISSTNAYHGIGIKQIQKIVKTNNGFVRFAPEADSFTVEILLPLENQTEERNSHED